MKRKVSFSESNIALKVNEIKMYPVFKISLFEHKLKTWSSESKIQNRSIEI